MLLAAAPQLLDSPCCGAINRVPWSVFMVVHVALFALAVLFALRMFQDDHQLLGLGFALFALAEVSYMTYHVNVTLFLFAHTVSEVLVGGGLLAIFTAIVKGEVVAHSERAIAPESRTSRKASAL